MTLKFSVTVRNGELNAIETAISTTAVLKIWDGAIPATIAGADSGNALVEMTLPVDWMDDASNGVKPKLGTWQTTSACITGSATHFRIYASNGSTQHIQGTVTITGAGGDMTLDNNQIAIGQTVVINTFTLTCGNP